MMLLVDAGNSRVKWALLTAGTLHGHGAFSWRGEAVEPQLARHWGSLGSVARVWVANVAGKSISAPLNNWVRAQWGMDVDYAQTQTENLGVRNGYRDHRRLGVDRWLTLLAACSRYRGASCILDCGTAVTLDALNATGEHLGGLIVPGIGLMHDALARHTDALALDPAPGADFLGHDTTEGIANGAVQGIAGFAEHAVERLRAQLGDEPHCLLTGGDAGRILPHLRGHWEHRPQLVLEGLQLVAESLV
jgi:type III pantothenate kinase